MNLVDGELLLGFMDEVAALRQSEGAPASWLRSRVLERDRNLCWHCEAVPADRVVPLFAPALGGVKSEANLVASCGRCRFLHALHDPLSLDRMKGDKGWSKGKAEQRFEALATAAQHQVPPAHRRSVVACRTWLEATRWTFPRVPIAVLHGIETTLLTTVQATPGLPWATLAFTAREAGAQSARDCSSVLEMPSEKWEKLAWAFIERGALLHRVHVAGFSEPAGTLADAQGKPVGHGRWDDLLQGTQGAARGREAKARQGFTSRRERA